MQVETLTPGRLDEAVDVLCDAFRDYPVMRFVIGPDAGNYPERVRALVHYFTAARFYNGDIVLGASDRGRLAGVANITRPGVRTRSPQLDPLREALWRELGPEARGRYDTLGGVWQRFAIPEPHFHLNMIGVRPTMKGRGVARLLLDALHDLSDRSPGSRGVSLTTEDPANVPLYRHVGYRITGHAEVVPGLETWGFFRPSSGPPGER